MQDNRLSNGVRRRVDNSGDVWANEHRQAFGSSSYMQDLDAVMGVITFGINGVSRLFAEYEPDGWENRNSLIRQFGIVALFDRKKTTRACQVSSVSTAFYLHMARVLSTAQPIPVRFFFVVGEQPPWQLIELDIETGEQRGTTYVADIGAEAIWDDLGLTATRKALHVWLNASER